MKMSQKLVLVFSLLSIIATAANSMYFYRARLEDLNDSTYENLTALGGRMVDEIEQYVQLMDYALEQLTTNVEFIDALGIASRQQEAEDIGEFVAVQTLMSRTLYQSPILDKFYRVSVYARNGFFLSNHFDKINSVTSLSDEARELVASFEHLSILDENPFSRQLLNLHLDPWISNRRVPVFSAVRAAVSHGQIIGYVEVAAQFEDVIHIFYVPEIEGLLAQAVFDDGTVLYRSPEDSLVCSDMDLTGMTQYRLEDGSERLVVRLRSKTLGLNVFISQDLSVYAQRVRELLMRYVTVSCVIIGVMLFFVCVFSLSITRSIRRLTRKMLHLPVDELMRHPEQVPSEMVTTRSDRDIYNLETVFNELIVSLQASHHAELTQREGALQAQLNALQMQINPHFMYNTLNIICAKAMEYGHEDIIEICDQFASMLRYSTDLHSKTATLADELENVHRYLLLAKARYEDKLRFAIDVPEQIKGVRIPTLTLQPIVENALTHGFSSPTAVRSIQISGTLTKGVLCLRIRDNGNGFDPEVLRRLTADFLHIQNEKRPNPPESGSHIGLANTYLRLYYYSKGKIQMRIYNDGGAVVELTFPCPKGEEDV